MTVTEDIEAEIRRLHYAEHWPVGTVASQTQQHADVVRRVLGLDTRRPSPTERLLLTIDTPSLPPDRGRENSAWRSRAERHDARAAP